MRYLPVIIGLLGCFATDARYSLGGANYSSRVSGDYSGWPVIIILIMLGIYTFWKQKKQKTESWMVKLVASAYLLGFVLFRFYQTFTLYDNATPDSLATQLHAKATPGEGLFLLAFAAIWILFQTFRLWKAGFSTTHE